MIPKELCHYTKKDIALEKILFKRQIKLGSCGNTNDPKETKARSIQVLSDIADRAHKDIDKIAKYAEKVTKDEWKVLCLTKSLPPIPEKTRKDMYLNFFLPGYNRPRMWAQYGENHSGVCLIFNGKRLSEQAEKLNDNRHTVFHGSVNYENYDITPSKSLDFSNVKATDPLSAIRRHYLEHHDYYFLSKHPDWRDETEYRWLIHSTTNSKKDEFINIEGALTAVLVGEDFPQVYASTLRELCKELNVSAGHIEWVNGFPYPQFGSVYNPEKIE